MGLFLGIVIIGLIGAAVGGGIYFIKKKKKRLTGFLCAAFAAAMFVAFIFIPFGFVQVDAGYVAVVKRYGQIKTYKTAGLHFRNIISDQYIIYDTKVQQLDIKKWCYVKDATNTTQVIEVVSTAQFNIIEPESVNIAKEYGSLEALKERVTTVILGILETSASEYTIDELVTGAGKIEYQNAVKDALTNEQNALGKTVESQFYISFRQIVIEEFVLEPALEEAMLKVRLAEAERKEREEQLKKEIAEVEAKAQQDEIKAQALRDIEKANAQNEILVKELLAAAKEAEALGEANALIERARGEAEALRLKSIELARSAGINIIINNETGKEEIDTSDANIGILVDYLEYIAYLEAWDGKLPQYVGGDWTPILPIAP